jgi:hypothetical protein
MPVFRYFVVMGCCLLGLLWVTDWMWPGDVDTPHRANNATAGVGADAKPAGLSSTGLKSKDLATTDSGAGSFGTGSAVISSVDELRRSEERFERAKPDPQPIIYPDIATLGPTPNRLQWESQLRYLPANHVYEARAEMPNGTTKGTTAEPPKVAERTAPPRKHVAHARNSARIAADVERSQPRYARNSAWNPFGLFD